MTLRGVAALGAALGAGCVLVAACNQAPPDTVGRVGVGLGDHGELEIHYAACGGSAIATVDLVRGREGLEPDEENQVLAEVALGGGTPGGGTVVLSERELPGGVAGLEAGVTHIADAPPEDPGERLAPVTFAPDQLTELADGWLLVGDDGESVAADRLRDC